MMKLLVAVLVFTLCLTSHAKHVHPRSIVHGNSELEDTSGMKETLDGDIGGVPIDVIRELKPSRFVPINSVLYFTSYPPCEEGFERDFLGTCREVWD